MWRGRLARTAGGTEDLPGDVLHPEYTGWLSESSREWMKREALLGALAILNIIVCCFCSPWFWDCGFVHFLWCCWGVILLAFPILLMLGTGKEMFEELVGSMLCGGKG